MSTPNHLQLHCFLLGDDDTFSVRIDSDEDIGDLKKAIAAENKNAFQTIGVDAKDLTLYSIVVEEDSIDETLPKVVDVAKLKKLSPSHKLSRYFSSTLPDNSVFAVIVQLPAGECKWLSNTGSADEILLFSTSAPSRHSF